MALSRVRSFDGLFLVGEFSEKSIRADPRATMEYERLQNVKESDCSDNESLTNAIYTVIVLNTR